MVVNECTTSTCCVAQTSVFYVGEASNLQTREHDANDGRRRSYTATRRPVRIVYAERHISNKKP